jgi:hypothetical protein
MTTSAVCIRAHCISWKTESNFLNHKGTKVHKGNAWLEAIS